jgi:hypothetical protein
MRNLNIFHIDKIVRDAGFGGSVPIIVSANNKEYVLKTKEDGMQPNSLGLFNELLAYQILSFLKYKISPQQVDYLYIDNNFIEMAEVAFKEGYIKEESYENIKNSTGINLGIEYLHNTMEPLDGKILNDSFIKDIAHIDNYIMNCDRSLGNINILQDKINLNRYYAIDFGNAMGDGIDGILYNKIVNEDTDIFSEAKFSRCNATLSGRYILKNDVKRLIKRGRIIKDDFSTIRNILDSIINNFPPDWEPVKYKNVIIEIISSRMKSKSIFNPTEKCGCII